jgi:hypothetical protein
MKGIVAALEKDGEDKVDTRSTTFEKDINDKLDGEWNDGNSHRMTFRIPVGAKELDVKTQMVLVKIAADRRLAVDIEKGHARYCIVVFRK